MCTTGTAGVTYSGCIDGSIYVWHKNQTYAIIPSASSSEAPLVGHYR